jgi:hypothetical protein
LDVPKSKCRFGNRGDHPLLSKNETKKRKKNRRGKRNKTRKEEEKRNTQREHSSRNACTTLFIAPSASKPNLKEIILYWERRLERMEDDKKH